MNGTQSSELMFKVVEWTRHNTLLIISLLKQHPCIWQSKHKDYKNRPMRNISMNIIASKLSQKIGIGITVSDITKKVHTLRSQYRREMRASRVSIKSEAISEDLYTPKLWCFDDLSFLDDSDTLQESTTTLDGLMSSQEFISDWEENYDNREGDDDGSRACTVSPQPPQHSPSLTGSSTPSPSPSPTPSIPWTTRPLAPPIPSPKQSTSSTKALRCNRKAFRYDGKALRYGDRKPSKKRKHPHDTDDAMSVPCVPFHKLSSFPGYESDPCWDYGKVVGNELREMTDTQRKLAKKLINDVIHLGAMDSLTPEYQVKRG